MIAAKERPAECIVLPNVSWTAYEIFAREIGERHIRLTYDDGDLEIMTLSFGHENAGEWLGRLIFFLALELRMPLCSGGSTTLKKALRRKGLEPDKSFWIQHEGQMRGKTAWDALLDPPPDLVAEVDITNSSLDRLGIYAALKVPEIWHYDGKVFRVLVLAVNGKYKAKTKSPTFPWLPIKEFTRFLHKLGTLDEVALIQAYIDWLQARVLPRKQAAEARQNGKSR